MFKNFIKEFEENWEQIGGKFDENLKNLFKCSEEKIVHYINILKEYSIRVFFFYGILFVFF